MPTPAFIDAVQQHFSDGHNVVVHAPTGAGKSTTLPLHLLRHAAGSRRILLVQPRQVAARAVAARIAELYGCTLGKKVGYHVRFDRRASDATELLVVTTGMALQYIQADPFLEDWDMLLLDEFHERSVDLDLLVAFARESQEALREDLRIAALSATLDVERAQEFLDAKIVRAQGRSFPITFHYQKRTLPPPWSTRDWERSWARLITHALEVGDGDILAFLPGVGEILRVSSALEGTMEARGVDVVHLHGSMRAHEQDVALREGTRRRIVLATNVAETSLTVPGIDTVVDFGWVRRARVHPGQQVNRIVLERVSQASADQRAGRAGRLRPGTAIRAWTDADHRRLDANEVPEILRIDVSGAVMSVLRWQGRNIESFGWFQPPKSTHLHAAITLLQTLRFMEGDAITERGKAGAQLPLHPRLAALVLVTWGGPIAHRAQLLAALLSETDFPRGFSLGRPGAESDIEDVLSALERGKTFPQTRRLSRIVRTIERACERMSVRTSEQPVAHVATALLHAFPDRLAQRRAPGDRRALLANGTGVVLDKESTVVRSPYFVALELDARQRDEMRVRAAVGLEEAQIPASWIVEEEIYRFSEEDERVEARQVRRVGAILLDEKTRPRRDVQKTTDALMQAAKMHQESLLAEDRGAQQWLQRYALAHTHLPEEFPALDDAFWDQVWTMACAGKHSFSALRKQRFSEHFRAAVGWSTAQSLDELLPLRLTVPSGKQHRLDYTEHGPVLAVRIQEMFGSTETPRVLRGRVPITLHLLAPNFRPQQVTDDLEGFWKNTYPEVRKELRARYAKHAWPEDPLSARAQSGAKRRR